MMDRFDAEVQEELGWYVYRLIDPRYGHTFYVGKGRGDRVFEHAKGQLKRADETDLIDDLKLDTIKKITTAGLSVQYVIHRHKIATEEIAYEIEAALIDAYPGLTNIVGGHASSDTGCRTVEQIIARYKADPLIVHEPLILIYVGRALEERDEYDAVRAAWKMKRERAERFKLVLAYDVNGIVVGAFRPRRWLPATKENFPFLQNDLPDRIGFEGGRATDVEAAYLKKKSILRKKGSMTPFRYLTP